MTSLIHSFLFQFFTDTRVGISPAGSAVIGPQIAQYILLRTATKNQFYHFCSFLVWWNAFTEHFERSLPFYKGKAVSGSQSTIGAKNKRNPQAQPQLTNRFELYHVFQLRHGCMRRSPIPLRLLKGEIWYNMAQYSILFDPLVLNSKTLSSFNFWVHFRALWTLQNIPNLFPKCDKTSEAWSFIFQTIP